MTFCLIGVSFLPFRTLLSLNFVVFRFASPRVKVELFVLVVYLLLAPLARITCTHSMYPITSIAEGSEKFRIAMTSAGLTP
jgi:hypothetical protein